MISSILVKYHGNAHFMTKKKPPPRELITIIIEHYKVLTSLYIIKAKRQYT